MDIKLLNSLKQWDKVWAWWEKRPYKVIWRTDRYIVIAKPYNLAGKWCWKFQYSIIDIEKNWMWPDNMIFWYYDYSSFEDTKEDPWVRLALQELEKWELEISQRYWCNIINFDKVEQE